MSRSRTRHRSSRGRRRSRASLNRTVPMVVAAVGVLVIGGALLLLNQNGTPRGYKPAFTGGPRVEVAQEVFDYGEVLVNTTIQTDFEIRNVGDQPLKIEGVPVVEVREGC